MDTSDKMRATEQSLEPALRQIFKDFVIDYNAAARIHTRYKGGINPGIAAELVRGGWHKQPNSN